jgi:hypothetical protein
MTNALVDALVLVVSKSCKGVLGYICHEAGEILLADTRREPMKHEATGTVEVDDISRSYYS